MGDLLAHSLVGQPVREELEQQLVTLAERGVAVVQRERPAKERIDIGTAGRDRADSANDLGERRALRDQPVDPGRESLAG